MQRYAAFVRNVMIGRKGLDRERLIAAFHDAGASGARSYLATGNITFDGTKPQLADLQHRVESAVSDIIGRHEPVFFRSLEYLNGLAKETPFGDAQPPIHERCVTFLPERCSPMVGLPIVSSRGDVSLIAATDLEVFSTTRLVGGRPGTAGPLVERALGVPVTTRNWNTVQRMIDSPR